MRVETRDDQSIFTADHFEMLFKALSLRLDGKRVTARIAHTTGNAAALGLFGGLLRELLLPRVEGGGLGGVTVSMPEEGEDLVFVVDIEGVDLSDDRQWAGLESVRFNDWRSEGEPEIGWVEDGLRLRLRFESASHEVEARVGAPGAVAWVDVQIDGFVLDLHFVPYVYWAPALHHPTRLLEDGTPALHNGSPDFAKVCTRDMYRQGCSVFVDFGWDHFSPDICGAEDSARSALLRLARKLASAIPAEAVYPYFDAMVIGERGFFTLGRPSTLRGVHVTEGQARLLFAEGGDELYDYAGPGRVVAVYKDHRAVHLDGPKTGPTELQDFPADDIYALVVQRPDGEEVTVDAIGLAESVQRGEAELEGVHVVQRKAGYWGAVQCDVPWGYPSGRLQRRAKLLWPPFLRGNPDGVPPNNLDALPERRWPAGDPLYRALYDGAMYYVHRTENHRTLYPRAWHLPTPDERHSRPLDGFVWDEGLAQWIHEGTPDGHLSPSECLELRTT
ncbi:MAG: hypothetical protein H6741_28900 [Alphaproteobacteria bacterium]|nr:hypothetical protein [Alphaproteobacteria bacterium]